jgi:lysophospholipase L1-like esterase
MSNSRNQWLDVVARLGKAVAIVLTGLVLFALIAMRASNNINASDYAGLPRYREDDARLASTGPANNTVFIGDSITDFWDLKKSFPNQPYINRGIGAQTTSQIVLRFHQDVVGLNPAAVVILAGINDVGSGVRAEQIENNYAAMAEMARANHILVYFGSVLPVGKSRRGFPPQEITALNEWLRHYCQNNGAVYVDYWSRMVDGSGFLLPSLSADGLHPNDDGYFVMKSTLASELSVPSPSEAKAGGAH